MSELARGRAEAVTHVPRLVELRRDADRVVSLAAVHDIKRNIVGVLVTAFSLARENEARAAARALGAGDVERRWPPG